MPLSYQHGDSKKSLLNGPNGLGELFRPSRLRPRTRSESGATRTPSGPANTRSTRSWPSSISRTDYPFNARVGNRELLATLAHAFDAEPENFVVGAGMGDLLRSSDKAIIAFRKLLLEMTNDLRNGREPEAARQAARYNVRSASVLLEKDVPFDEGAAWFLFAEERPRR